MTSLTFATTRLATGPRLHYAHHGDPDGEPVVFLHGWPDSWFSFSRVLPLLPRQFRAFVPDQRGFGDSDRPDGQYRIDDFAADAVAFLDAMAVQRATLVGHSFGSFVARHVAVAHPDRVSRLALIGTGVSTTNPVMREVQSGVRDLTDPVPVQFARDFQASTVYRPLPEWFFERIVAESLKLPARLWRDVFDGLIAFADEGQLGAIAASTLVMWGERDALFPRDDQDRLVAAIRNARLTIYPETGHCPNWERPEAVTADLMAFLQPA